MEATRTTERARHLVSLSGDWSDLRARADALLARTSSSEFRIAVVGEFKRGKSTLLNALLGRELLPTGVLPVTAVPIEIAAGTDGGTVLYGDGRSESIQLARLPHFTTEAENPENRLNVTRVDVTLQSDLLQHGLTLVDVPGMGSIHEAATETAKVTYQKVDGAVLVLSMDSPLSASECGEAQEIVARGARLFVVINKSDRFDADQIADVRGFVSDRLGEPRDAIYCLSALAALRGEHEKAGDFLTFETALRTFVAEDLAQARNDLLERELSLIGTAIGERSSLELLAGELDIDELTGKVATLEDAITEERLRHDSDRRAMVAEMAAVSAEIRSRLLASAEDAYEARRSEFVNGLVLDETLLIARRAVSQHVESLVREEISRIWTESAGWLETRWQRLAERHVVEVERRLGAVRSATAELFSVELSLAPPPALEHQPDENLYYFPPPMSVSEGLIDPIRRLVPARAIRHKVESDAEALLHRELAKHAGRAGALLQERLDASWLTFDRAMRRYMDETVAAIQDALARALQLRNETDAEIQSRRVRLIQIVAELHSIEADS